MCVNSLATEGPPSTALMCSAPSGSARSRLTRMVLFRSQESSRASSSGSDMSTLLWYSPGVMFAKRLRDGVRRGQITCSIRIWMRPHVTVGKRYAMEEGEIEVDSILPISFADITPELARASGFKGVVDLLKIAKHGRGENVYLVRFHYVPPRSVARRKRG